MAFVTLLTASIKRVLLNQEDRLEIGRDSYPALQIGQLAVDINYEDSDVGTYVLDWSIGKAIALSDQVGCRFVVLDAEKDAIGFYEKAGFKILRKQDKRYHPTMFLDLFPHVKS